MCPELFGILPKRHRIRWEPSRNYPDPPGTAWNLTLEHFGTFQNHRSISETNRVLWNYRALSVKHCSLILIAGGSQTLLGSREKRKSSHKTDWNPWSQPVTATGIQGSVEATEAPGSRPESI